MVIVPTVLAATADEFATRLEVAADASTRIHIDVADGQFTPTATIGLAQMYPPDQPRDIDLHLMVQRPSEQLETALSLKPDLVIVHAEAYDAVAAIVTRLHALGVRAGLAILPQTEVTEIDDDLIAQLDHALIFTGTLGSNGGAFDATQLSKVAQLKALHPGIELSVDGGVTAEVLPQLTAASIDVAYVGNAIQAAADPAAAYAALVEAAV